MLVAIRWILQLLIVNTPKCYKYIIFIAQMKLRHKLIKENYKEVFVTNEDDNIKDAKQELLEMIVDHLPKQFPDKFESREGGVYNKIGRKYQNS